MKSHLYLMILIILASTATAVVAGQNYSIIHVDDCTNMTVSVEGNTTIDVGEYSLINCTETTNNTWDCICNGSTDLVLQTEYNTINNYIFTINYTYTQTTADPTTGGGSSGGSGSSGGGSHYTYNNTNSTFYVNPALQYVTEPKPVVRPVTPEPTPITETTPISGGNNETVVAEPEVLEPVNKTIIVPETEPLDTTSIFRAIGVVGGISICLLGILGLIIWAVFFREKKKKPEVIVEQKQDIDEEYNNMMNSLK